jgi:hypothetical protein
MERRVDFLANFVRPHPLRALQSIRVPPCFLIANRATNLDVGGKNSLGTWIKSFFFIPQFTIVNAPMKTLEAQPLRNW